MAELELVGREPELSELAVFLDSCTHGPCALEIEGEAGAGKTALWQEGVRLARLQSRRVLLAQPVEIETKLSFSGLTDLLEPVVDEVLPELPEPQRSALEIALLRVPSPGLPDQRGVAAAFLNALRVLAEAGPPLVAIDDVQWLDSSSRQVVAFAARRLISEPVGFLLTRRTSDEQTGMLELDHGLPAERLERMRLGPLSLEALHHLVETRLGSALSRPLLQRVGRVSGGNPFYALELVRALDHADAGAAVPPGLPVPQTLRLLIHNRLGKVPPGEHDVLLAVAALASPTRELLAAVEGRRDDAWPRLPGAFELKIVEIVDGRMRFTHPLLGSVLYAETPLPDRQALHRRLSEIVRDPEESARHLALAAAGPDEPVATTLESAAEHAGDRGAPSSAAELLDLAIELTPPDDRTALRRRRLEAADRWTAAGDTSAAYPLLEEALAASAPGSERVDALTRLAGAACDRGDFRAGATQLAEALAEPCDDPLVRMRLEKMLVWNSHMLGDLETSRAHAENAVLIAGEHAAPAALAEMLADLALIQMLRSEVSYRATMDRALSYEQNGRWQHAIGQPVWLNAMILAWAGDLTGAEEQLKALNRRATELGDEHTRPYALTWLGRIACYTDDWALAARYANDAYELCVQSGQEAERVFALASKALVSAHTGDVDATREATDEGLALAQRVGIVPGVLEHRAIRGFLELSLGDLDAAHGFLAPLPAAMERHGFREPAVFRFHPDLIETLVARGDTTEATTLLAELEASARRLGSPWARSHAARCRALLASDAGDHEGAFRLFESALAEHARSPGRFEGGRTTLLYGIALRRAKQRRAARERLESAESTFARLGATVWAGRAQAELARVSGARPRAEGLTETERRIGELAAAGKSNKQIAAELHVTVRTVESNLTRIYRKLGVSSRGQLTNLIRP